MIACYAMQNPIFREIVATQYYAPRHWKNKNKMLTALEGAIGVKTGYTKEAGRCLVTALKREEMTLVCSVLNSPMMYERSIMLLEDAFKAYSYKKILSAEEPLDIDNGKKRVKGVSKKEFYYPLLKEEEDLIEIKTTPNYSKDEDERGKIIGQFEIYLAKQLLFSGNLYKL